MSYAEPISLKSLLCHEGCHNEFRIKAEDHANEESLPVVQHAVKEE